MDEAYREFKEDQKDFQHKKDDRANALKALEKEVVVAQQKSRESLQWAVKVVCRV